MKSNKSPTEKQLIKDLQDAQSLIPLKTLTRLQYKKNGVYSDETVIAHFGSWMAAKRKAGIIVTKEGAKMAREKANQAEASIYREFYDNELAKYYDKYPKKINTGELVNLLFISDIHSIDSDGFTTDVFIDTCKRQQPDIIVLGGDIVDFAKFSTFTTDTRKYSLTEEFKWLDSFLSKVRKSAPEAQIDFLCGNHEIRLIKHLADKSPEIREVLDYRGIGIAELFGLDKYKINFVSRYDMGAWSASQAKRAAKKNFKIYYNTLAVCHIPNDTLKDFHSLSGHHHSTKIECRGIIDPRTGQENSVVWVQSPCACDRDAEYLTSPPNWRNGFVQALIDTSKRNVQFSVIDTTGDSCVVATNLYKRT